MRPAHKYETAGDWFWPKVDKSGECWIWTATKTRDGYGAVKVMYRPRTAHSVSWELANGPIPDGLIVCHNCPGGDNPSCVNPAHLFLGTYSDNQNDRWDKFRADPANDHALYIDRRGVKRYSSEALGWQPKDPWKNRRSVKESPTPYGIAS